VLGKLVEPVVIISVVGVSVVGVEVGVEVVGVEVVGIEVVGVVDCPVVGVLEDCPVVGAAVVGAAVVGADVVGADVVAPHVGRGDVTVVGVSYPTNIRELKLATWGNKCTDKWPCDNIHLEWIGMRYCIAEHNSILLALNTVNDGEKPVLNSQGCTAQNWYKCFRSC
jgi:hypothetical protein